MGCASSSAVVAGRPTTTAGRPMVRSAPPACTLLSPAEHMKGSEKTTIMSMSYRVDGFVECSKFLKGFQLKQGDEVVVHPDLASLKQSCDDAACGWDEDKENYIVSLKPQDVGTVGKCDYLGQGRRVQWCDGHWWSFAPEVLAVRLASLNANQKQFLPEGSEEWVVWKTKSKSVLQVPDLAVPLAAAVAPEVATTTAGDKAGDGLDAVEKAVMEAAKDAGEALVEDAAQALVEDEVNDDDSEDEDDEDEDSEEDEEEEDEDSDDGSDGLPGGRKAKKALKAGKMAYSIGKMAYQFASSV